jgi:single-strand DNA-binding protein
MSNKGMIVTVVGWAATKPREITGRVPFTSFRVATTPRYYDNSRGSWTDGHTEWLTVKVFRDVALNVAASVNKGDPVVVHGRLRTEEWEGENGPRSGLVLEASALGHDLTRGRAAFARTVHAAPAEATDDAPATGTAEEDPWAIDAPPTSTSADAGPAAEDAMAMTP